MTRRVCLMAFSTFTVWCCAVLWVRGSDPDTGTKTITNSIGMKLVSIPAGEFQMGSQETAEELAKAFEAYGKPKAVLLRDEHPRHRVRITKPFYLGVYEVTVGQFGKFVSDTGYKTDAERNKDFDLAYGFNAATGEFERNQGHSWRQVGFPQGDDHPVVNVSHNDAVAFCAWLSRKEGQPYRLPTEAEWEYACRAGTTTRYYRGDDAEGLSEVGNVADGTAKSKFSNWNWTIAGRDGYVFTAPVGKYKANGFGLYDMHGNVWEWCADWYDGKYYEASPVDDPTGPTGGSIRVFRGGGWLSNARYCRAADRIGFEPSRHCYGGLGFRIARTVSLTEGRAASPQKSSGKTPQSKDSPTPKPATPPPVAKPVPPWNLPAGSPDPAIAPFDAAKAKEHQAAWAKHLRVPVELTNSIGMKFMLIPPGEFDMGSTEGEVARLLANQTSWYIELLSSEAPKHRVRITKPFYLVASEVTQSQYERVMGNNPSKFKKDANCPVEMVNWDEASAFCRKLSELSEERSARREYRLPTEAEWEYACRAGTTTTWYSGADEAGLKEVAWYAANAGGKTHPVCEKTPNAWGLCDMHGNVWEWCQDWWAVDYYATSPLDDPTGPKGGSDRVYRGGSWNDVASDGRASIRWYDLGIHYSGLGFRLARTVSFPPP